MPDFAKEIGITRDRLASYEYARAPLRYGLAAKLCEVFNVNQRWLAEGKLPIRPYFPFAGPALPTISDKMLFSLAYYRFLRDPIERRFIEVSEELSRPASEIPPHLYRVFEPIGSSKEDTIVYRLDQLHLIALRMLPERDWEAYEHEMSKWSQTFTDILRKRLESPAETSRKHLTATSQLHTNTGAMKSEPTLKELLARLKTLTAPRGNQAALAKAIGVSQGSVSEWLRGDKEPGGEITLRLLKWVRELERK